MTVVLSEEQLEQCYRNKIKAERLDAVISHTQQPRWPARSRPTRPGVKQIGR